MSSIGYKLKCLKNLNMNSMFEVINKIHEKTKISKIQLLFD